MWAVCEDWAIVVASARRPADFIQVAQSRPSALSADTTTTTPTATTASTTAAQGSRATAYDGGR